MLQFAKKIVTFYEVDWWGQSAWRCRGVIQPSRARAWKKLANTWIGHLSWSVPYLDWIPVCSQYLKLNLKQCMEKMENPWIDTSGFQNGTQNRGLFSWCCWKKETAVLWGWGHCRCADLGCRQGGRVASEDQCHALFSLQSSSPHCTSRPNTAHQEIH